MKEVATKTMKINIGPQHPSTHGVLRLVLELDGEVIKKSEPIIGYLHRGLEKMAESRSYFQYLPIVDRVDYLSSFFCAEAYCQAVESLAEITVPIKAQYIRTLLMELNRIASHLMWLSSFMLDLGATSPLFYCFEEREIIFNLLESLTGQRMMYNYHTFGGIKQDLTEDFLARAKDFCTNFPAKVKEYENIITQNPIFLTRTKNVGILTKKMALAYSITGASLRASGISLDYRKNMPYLVYDKLNFDVPTSNDADTYARYLLRIEEMRQSAKIVMQCVDWLAKTEETRICAENIRPAILKPNAGMAVSYIEAPRGLLNCIVISDGSNMPVRVKWRTPSFYAVQVLPELIKNHMYPDLMAIFGSFDVVLPEVDR